jgi:hypothetical protein
MLWALSDPSGLPAKRFAEVDPVPSLDWLEPLSEKRFGSADLARFGVAPQPVVDDKLSFSLMCRPSPYPLAPLMCVVDGGVRGSQWNDVMRHLAAWLTRHLGDPALLLWLVEQGGRLHESFVRLVEDSVEELTRFEQQGGADQLNAIRTNAPRAIPDRAMRTLWELLLPRRVKVSHQGNSFFSWLLRFEREELTTVVRLQLREVLTPRVELRKLMAPDKEHSERRTIADFVQWKIVLSMEDIAQFRLPQQKQDKRWTAVLPELLPDFTMLLRDALDLMRELGGADEKKDDPPPIRHPSARIHRIMVSMIEPC